MKKLVLAAFLLAATTAKGQEWVLGTDAWVRADGGDPLTVGGVTSVDCASSQTSTITCTGGPVTTTGTLTVALPTQVKNLALLGPASGADAVPAFRALVSADLSASPTDDAIIQSQSGALAWATPGTTTELADATTGSESAGTSDKWARADHVHHVAPPTQRASFTIFNPGGAEDAGGTYFTAAATITKIHCVLPGGTSTPSVTPSFKYGTDRSSGTSVTSSPSAVTSVTTGSDLTLNNTAIPTSGFLWMTTTAQSGTVPQIACTVEYTQP